MTKEEQDARMTEYLKGDFEQRDLRHITPEKPLTAIYESMKLIETKKFGECLVYHFEEDGKKVSCCIGSKKLGRTMEELKPGTTVKITSNGLPGFDREYTCTVVEKAPF